MNTASVISPLSEAERTEIETEIAHLPDRESAAIDALMIVQKHRGWVSNESLHGIAKFLEMSPAKLDGIATFYNLIYRQPVGRNVVMVCDSVSCYVMGYDRLAKKVQQQLGIKFGETTPDNCFTLLPIVCLGACDRAPTMLINEDLFGPVQEEDLADVFSRYT